MDRRAEAGLSLLEALCADQKGRLKEFFDRVGASNWDSKVDDALTEIENHFDFAKEIETLKQCLKEPTIGYEAWGKAMKSLVLSRLTNPSECHKFLGVRHEELVPPLNRSVRRSELEATLNNWWSSNDKTPIVILGEEGIGKSWACLYWLLNSLPADGPPIIPIPSRLRTGDSLISCIANICSTGLTGANEDQWEVRLKRWAAGNPLWCLPYFDGLYEVDDKEKLPKLLVEGHIVVATCRAVIWRERLSRWSKNPPYWNSKFILPGLTDTEFEELCKLRSVKLSDFHGDTQTLMRKPRYFDLAVQFRSQIQEDDYLVTPDLLLALDWESRVSRSSTLQQRTGIDRDDFQAGIRALCKEYEGRVEVNSVGELFGTLDDPRTLCQLFAEEEIFYRDPASRKWTVHSNYFVLGLGLAMAEQVRLMQPDSGFAAESSKMLEPASEMDQKAKAWGIACALTWRDAGGNAIQSIELLKSWLGMPNADLAQQKAFLASIPPDKNSFQSTMEALWLTTGSSHGQEMFLQRLYEPTSGGQMREEVWPHLVTSWIGLYLESGHPVENRLRKTREEVRSEIDAYDSTESEARPWCKYLRRLPDNLKPLMRLRFFALDLIHRLPNRAQFAPALVSWLVASALNQSWDDDRYFTWVVETHYDELWPALHELAQKLSEEVPAEKRARQMLSDFIDCQGSSEPFAATQTHWIGMHGVAESVLDPEQEVEPATEEQILSRCKQTRDEAGHSDHEVELWVHYAAAREVHIAQKLLDNYVAGLAVQNLSKIFKGLAFFVQDNANFLTENSLPSLRMIRRRIMSDEAVDHPRRQWTEALVNEFIFLVESPRLWALQKTRPLWQMGYGPLTFACEEEFDSSCYEPLVAEAPEPADSENSLRYLKWFRHDPPPAARELLVSISSNAHEQARQHALNALLTSEKMATEEVECLLHAPAMTSDFDNRVILAELLLRFPGLLSLETLLSLCPLEILLQILVLRGAQPSELSRAAIIYRKKFSTLDQVDISTCRAELRPFYYHRSKLTYPDISDPSQASPFGVEKRDYRDWWGGARPELDPLPRHQPIVPSDDDEYEQTWRGLQDMRLKAVEAGNPWWGSFWNGSNLRLLLECDPDLLTYWLEAYKTNPSALESAPQLYESLFAYLLTQNATEALELYRALLKAEIPLSIDCRTDLPVMVHEIWRNCHTMTSEVWGEIWQCESDLQVLQLCVAACLEGAADWIEQRIDLLQQRLQPLGAARALTLSRFIGKFPSYELLSRVINSDRWNKFNQLADREQHAIHWYKAFLESPDRVSAAANFHCFCRLVDYRYHIWRSPIEADTQASAIQARILRVSHSRLQKAITKNSYKLYHDRLYGLSTPMFVRSWFGFDGDGF